MRRRGLRLQGGEQLGRTLHRDPLMVEVQAMQTAELSAVAGATRPTMMTLRHDDAVASVAVRDGRLNRQNASV